MDYSTLKTEIKEITDIASSVPEEFRQRTFEILLARLLDSQTPPSKHIENGGEQPANGGGASPVTRRETPAGGTGTIPMKAQLRVFMQRTGVTGDELQRVVMVEDDDVHFVREPAHGTVAKGQMEWALLLALKQAILQNEFSTDPEDVRSICQEKGFYDKGNFAATFKKPTNASYFRAALEPQGPRQTLTNDGQTALGQLIKRLAAGAPAE